ncbi:hypothetical protein [Stappia sp. ES.058]|uniref:hypothetical protein n=1 Tax=Stappia sp. ES.058 TaxID=1881061 RepID=UPI0008796B4C|nr:hypothetical protein [Stappia sp. ES.058]SDU12735.1 hypothetical protein SAMN05428979_1785 [Stappia sp. ES.058]
MHRIFSGAPLRRILPTAALAASIPLTLAAQTATADPVKELVETLPGDVTALTRIPGAEGSPLSFVVVRQTNGDRLFIVSRDAAETTAEVTGARALAARITGLRSELDSYGLAAFVDLRTPEGEETTYELFLEGETPSSHTFRPASN